MSMTDNESQSASKLASPDVAQPSASGGTGGALVEPGRRSLRQLLRGDLGFLPVLATLILIAIIFQIITTITNNGEGLFLKTGNISDVLQQVVTTGIIAIAAVLVLLLGEIDLSLVAVAQSCGALMAVLIVRQDWPALPAMAAALALGAIIGLFNGFLIAVLRIPAFIVTLAGSIAYAGLVLLVLSPQASLSVRGNSTVDFLTKTRLPNWLSYLLALVAIGLYATARLLTRQARARAGLKTVPYNRLLINIGIVAVVLLGVVVVLDSSLGVPTPVVIWIGMVALFWLILTQTSFGRHIYAVGGNAEASRRAGINVVGLRVAVFTLASTVAAWGGIMQASRGTAAESQINPTLLLNAIAAAVIGGVSLFGGRGTVWAVVLGALIIGSLENGLNLLSAGQDVKNITEGIVLVLAVAADALLRRANATTVR